MFLHKLWYAHIMSVRSIIQIPTLSLHAVDITTVSQMQAWKYTGIMARYNFSDDPFEQQWVCRPQTGYWQVRDTQHELLGFAVIGTGAQTAGIHYQANAIDVLAGLHPDLLGQRRGYAFITQVIAHAQKLHPGQRLRASIPSMHLAALAAWQRAGFFPEYAVISADNTPFVVLLA
jgi:GNAT superfamily N-acetyltransferase